MDITDPQVAGAIRLAMAHYTERRKALEAALAVADADHKVMSALHDLLIEAEHEAARGHLRSVS